MEYSKKTNNTKETKTMPKVKETANSRYKTPDNMKRCESDKIKPSYPSRYKK